MVFSSIPAYLDPANWQQQPSPHHHHHHLLSGSNSNNNINNNSQLHPLPPPSPPPPSNPGGGGSGPGGAGSIRPGMSEPALKCPRCDSTNTKFCYFNNYSSTQPRHFCKTCRRYWTRGGALRNVPVGGGCRRNKRSSKGGSSQSKSPVSSSDRPTGSASSSGQAIPSNSSAGTVDMMAAGLSPQIPPLRFINPFTDHHFSPSENLGMNYGLSYGGGVGDLGFQLGSGLGGGITSTPSGSLFEQQWRFQQQTPSFPFLSEGLDYAPGLFEGSGVEFLGYNTVRPRLLSSGSSVGVSSQMASVKTEDPHNQNHQQQEINLSRQLLGIQGGNDSQYWINGAGGNANGTSTTAWTDLSGFSSTSTATNHPL